jgi:hypothetical protein
MDMCRVGNALYVLQQLSQSIGKNVNYAQQNQQRRIESSSLEKLTRGGANTVLVINVYIRSCTHTTTTTTGP